MVLEWMQIVRNKKNKIHYMGKFLIQTEPNSENFNTNRTVWSKNLNKPKINWLRTGRPTMNLTECLQSKEFEMSIRF